MNNHETRITNNTKSIQQNTKNIQTNTDNIAKINTKIADNTQTINNHETRITNNSAAISQNTQNIQENSARIEKNTADIQQLRQEMNQTKMNFYKELRHTDKRLRAGISGSIALTQISKAVLPGEKTIGAAVGSYAGESAVAVGFSRASDNGKVILNLGGTATSRGDVGGAVGMNYRWK